MEELNEVHLIGRVARQPVSKTTTNGHSFTNFALKTKSPRAKFDNMTFCKAWGELAAEVALFSVNDVVEVFGELRNSKYKDKKTGEDKYFTEVVAKKINAVQATSVIHNNVPQSDDLPF